MEDNHQKFIVVFFLVLLVSCAYSPVPKYLKKQQFSFCYTKKSTGIDSLINIEGYFIENVIGENDLTSKIYYMNNRRDTMSYTSFMFYKNGICTFGFYSHLDSISLVFKEIINNKNNFFYNANTNIYWGVYQIQGDTIKLQVINHPSLMSPTWMAYEEWYKIINKNTLQPLAYRRLDIDFENKNKTNQQMIILDLKKHLPATFFPVKEIPEPKYSWLLKQKWFWCDEKAYKAWKRKVKSSANQK